MKFSQPNITEAEVQAAASAIREGDLATGKHVSAFETEFIGRFGHKYAVAVNSGTTALTLGLKALGVGEGDEVIVTAYSIAATVNAVLAVGATPVFCDINRQSYNLDPELLPDLVTEKTAAILPASIFGVPCDVARMRWAAPGIPILEDSIEALGAYRQGLPVGRNADVATFGFYPNKQITTCQGGMIVTDRPDVAALARSLRQHGYGDHPTLWDQAFGLNVRLPDPLAAMGVVQITRLLMMQEVLSHLAYAMDAYFKPYRKQRVKAGDMASHFIYGIELPVGVDKFSFCQSMEVQGVPVRPYFNPLHRSKHVELWYRPCPVADEVGSRTIALPFHWEMTQEDVAAINTAFTRCLQCAF